MNLIYMNKNKLNKYFKKFGFELHGIGFMEKLRNESTHKNEWDKQRYILEGKAATIFDVGASMGTSATNYMKIFPKATIHSFEPFPQACQTFKERHSNHSNIKLNEFALSSIEGKAIFNVNHKVDTNSFLKSKKIGIASDKSCETVAQIEVPTNTLDNYCKQNNIKAIDILKLDVQGFEVEVFKGGGGLLASGAIKLIFVEMFFEEQYENQALFFDIATLLYQNGFVLQDLYDPYYSATNLVWCDAIFINKKLF